MDIRELVRHIQGNGSDRAVARETGAHRKTVTRYRRWAEAQGLLAGPLPPLEEMHELLARTCTALAPPQVISSVTPYGEQVVAR